MVLQAEEYYALCAEREGGESEVAIMEVGRDERGIVDAIAVYTSPDGPAQQEDLKAWETEHPGTPSVRKVRRVRARSGLSAEQPPRAHVEATLGPRGGLRWPGEYSWV